MRFSRVIVLSVLTKLSAVLAERTTSIRREPDVASLPAAQPNAASPSFLRGDPAEERVNLTPMISVGSFKKVLESSRVEIVSSLRAHQWFLKKSTVNDIFLRLKLNTGLDEPLSSPNFRTWIKYVDLLNRFHPKGRKISLIQVLTEEYTDLALAKKIEAFLLVEPHSKMAKRLAKEQRKYWSESGYSAIAVFKLLELPTPGLNIFERPELSTWYKFVMASVVEKVGTYATKDALKEAVAFARNLMASVLAKYYTIDAMNDVLSLANMGEGHDNLHRTYLQLGTAVIHYQNLKQSSHV